MQRYGVRDVEKMLRLPRRTILALASAGFVNPTRGPRNAWLFSFQDLIVLRTAQTLADANVPAKRIARSLKQLRRQLPETMPLSGLSISAVGEHVVVRDGAGHRRADSGQYLLAFDGGPADGTVTVIPARPERAARAAPDWFERGEALERGDAQAALDAYQCAIEADPRHVDARLNLGRLLHELGRLDQAEIVYREALSLGAQDPLTLYNLGVLLGDADRGREAAPLYEAALRVDPQLADAHYNLALLYEKFGKPRQALRHLAAYRRLTKPRR